jgi:hypothetical protein
MLGERLKGVLKESLVAMAHPSPTRPPFVRRRGSRTSARAWKMLMSMPRCLSSWTEVNKAAVDLKPQGLLQSLDPDARSVCFQLAGRGGVTILKPLILGNHLRAEQQNDAGYLKAEQPDDRSRERTVDDANYR